MEQVRDLNMEADEMQVLLSAINSVSKRINPNRSLENFAFILS